MARIEVAALNRGGMNLATATATVNKAIKVLKDAGVKPRRIPWGGKNAGNVAR